MNDQLTLADAPNYRRDDLQSAKGAAEGNRPKRGEHRARVLAALKDAGPDGLTDFQIAEAVGLTQPSAGKRRLDLQRLGLVGPRVGVRRLSPSGSPAQVWRAL